METPDFGALIDHPDYDLAIDGMRILVKRGIFAPNPALSHSTQIVLDHLPTLDAKTVLDMGTGCGVLALACARRGASRVIAADNDLLAVDNAKENVRRYHTPAGTIVDVIQSNLFEKVSGCFDYILANLPIIDTLWRLETSTTSLLELFLSNAPAHLNPSGRIYLPWFSLCPVEPVRDLLSRSGYSTIEHRAERLGFTWYLFIASRTK